MYVSDINECEKKNGGCSDQCTNTIGSFICSCPKGFRLKIDYLTCEGKSITTLTPSISTLISITSLAIFFNHLDKIHII